MAPALLEPEDCVIELDPEAEAGSDPVEEGFIKEGFVQEGFGGALVLVLLLKIACSAGSPQAEGYLSFEA